MNGKHNNNNTPPPPPFECQCHPRGFAGLSREKHVPLRLRDAYFGGRTSALKHYHRFEGEGQGKYFDFTSLYPWALKYGEFPISHPTKMYTHQTPFLEPCHQQWRGVKHCPKHTHRHNRLPFFGIAKVKVIPPSYLLHPVLPYRCSSGKLVFPLCKTCAENNNQDRCQCSEEERSWIHTYCSGELEVALDHGYQLAHYYEVLHWERSTRFQSTGGGWDQAFTQGLFAGYVNAFLQIKQQASGFPSQVLQGSADQQQVNKQRYLQNYYRHEGIQLNPDEMKKSSSLRSLAKLLLNSLYGKFGQRLNFRQTHLVDNIQLLCDLMCHPKHQVVDFHVITPDLMQVETEKNIYFQQPDLKTNVVIAAFTTSWARLKLWGVMHQLGRRVFYTDTDSLIFESIPSQPDPVLGDFLGELADELCCKKVNCVGCPQQTHSILEFVACGAKNYAYITDNGFQVCKIRGFSLNHAASQILNFDTMRSNLKAWFDRQHPTHQSVEGGEKEKEKEEHAMIVTSTMIARDKYTACVYNRKISKLYGLVLDKQRLLPNYHSVPFGYMLTGSTLP